jgi:tetratricopeptide (TPR) repeat protein
MACRVAAAAVVVLLAVCPDGALGGVLGKAGMAQVFLGRWENALTFFDAAADPDRATRYFRAVALLELALPGEGLSTLRRLSDTGGAFAGPALEVAVAHLFEAEAFDAVVEWVESSQATRFRDADAFRYHVGQSYALLGRPEQALPLLEAVAAGPMRAYAQHTTGLIRFSQGRLRDAVAALGAAVETAGSHPNPAIASVLRDRIRLSRGRMIYQLALEGGALSDEGRKALFSLARAQFTRVVAESPLYAEALRGIGWCALELGNPAQALAAFGSAASLDPVGGHEDLWAQGRVYQRQGYPDEAARVYAEARSAALAGAEQLESGRHAVASGAEVRRWETVLGQAAAVRSRSTALAEEIELVAGALEGRGLRLEAAGRDVERADEQARAFVAELDSLAATLASYLDRIPASKLFRRAERGRLQDLQTRQERLTLEIARLEAAFTAFGASRLWPISTAGVQARTESLWLRLEGAKERLAGAQLRFLQALKQRVSIREAELVALIEELRSGALALDTPIGRARARLDRAREQLAEVRTRFASVTQRRERALERIAEIEREVTQHAEAAARAAAVATARTLRLRADAYALDETQALHLWKEGVDRSRAEDGR